MFKTEFITSSANPLLKEVRSTLTRGELTTGGHCIVETFHLLEEALRSRCRVRTVIAGESARNEVESLIDGSESVRLVVVPDQLLNATAAVVSSQGVLAIVEPPTWTIDQTLGDHPLVLIINGVQDPGNLGTILRSAEAFGASGLLLLKGSVSPFNPKALRASAGSFFRVPFAYALEESRALEAMRQANIEVYAGVASSNRQNSLAEADLRRPCAIVIGSEGQGVSMTIRAVAKDLSIPTAGVESLNAAVSASILLYEARRQRLKLP